MATVYVSPVGSGDGSGSSASNAMAFALINAAIQGAGPGGTVMLLADQGVTHHRAGDDFERRTEGAPVTVKGVDSFGTAMDVQIRARGPRPTSPTCLRSGTKSSR